MSQYRPALLASGPGWVEADGVSRSTLCVTDAQSPLATLPTGATLAYTLTPASGGAAVLVGTATKVDGQLMGVTTLATTAALDVSLTYRERWYGTITGTDLQVSTINVYREARASRHAFQLRYPPIGTFEVLAERPALSDYPTGQTSWDTLLQSAWFRVSRRLFKDLPAGEVWAPDDLAEPTMSLFLAMWNEQAATFAGSTYLDAARYYRNLYESFWAVDRAAVDSDGDGSLDVIAPIAGSLAAPSPRT